MTDPAPYILRLQNFRSNGMDRSRGIHICLPQCYCATAGKRYPVLYLHDGQNLFDDDRSYSGTAWDIHRIVHHLTRAGEIEPLILVAIDHGGSERLAEFAHQDRIFDGRMVSARGPLYERFLIDELKPYIDRHFLTRTEAAQTALMGSSMGGLVSFNIGLRRPDVFAKIAALSPSLWWHPAALEGALQRQRNSLSQLRLWLDSGGREGEFGALVPAFAARIGQLLGNSDSRFHYHFDAAADHSESAWRARVRLPLKFLFPA